MNEYEAKKQARIDRYRDRARKANREASARFNSSNIQTLRGMMGEPIKIGHHSEGRHRRLIERADRDMSAAVAATDKANHYEQKAEAAECSTAISSDDPAAVIKLREKLAELEAEQAEFKSDNAALRKAKIPTDDPAAVNRMLAAGISGGHAAELASTARVVPYQMGEFIKWPSYALSNHSANVRRVRERLAVLEKQAAAAAAAAADKPAAEIVGNGWRIVEDVAENRVCIIFPGKPAAEVRNILKQHAFRWSPSRWAWVRMLNSAGRYAAESATKRIDAMQGA